MCSVVGTEGGSSNITITSRYVTIALFDRIVELLGKKGQLKNLFYSNKTMILQWKKSTVNFFNPIVTFLFYEKNFYIIWLDWLLFCFY